MAEFEANLRVSGRHAGVVVPRADRRHGRRAGARDDLRARHARRRRLRAARAPATTSRRSCARRCGRGSKGALVHGLFHGDVHAGNLAVTPEGKVAFLDFGITGRLDERTRKVLRRALPAVLIDGDFGAVVRGIFALGAATEAGRHRCRDRRRPRRPRAPRRAGARRHQLRRGAEPGAADGRGLPGRAAPRARADHQAAPLLRALRQGADARLPDARRPVHRRAGRRAASSTPRRRR